MASIFEEVLIASDSGAEYFLLETRENSNRNIEALTRRVGPSGVSYAVREIRPRPLAFRYLAEGDTVLDLVANRAIKPQVEFAELLEDSISDVVVRFAVSAHREGKKGHRG